MSDSPIRKVAFHEVVEYLSNPQMIGTLRPEILEDRLSRIGVQAALEEKAIASQGFPFRYHSSLDEAILVLDYFLSKSKKTQNSYIQINSTHVPTKEEENTLASWKS